MTAVTYTAKRSLIAGHTADTDYDLDLAVLVDTPGFTRRPTVEVSEAMGGRREVRRLNAVKTVTIRLASLSGTPLAQVREFLDSVESGEEFLFDFYGSIASPVDVQTATLQDFGYSEVRTAARGAGGGNDSMSISFTVRIVDP